MCGRRSGCRTDSWAQGSEQKNGEYRSDLSRYGCTNGWSEKFLSRNKFYQRTIREFRSTFFNTCSLAQPEWCRYKFAGDCSLCGEFGHRRPTCPLKARSLDTVFVRQPELFQPYRAWLAQLPAHADSPPVMETVSWLPLLVNEARAHFEPTPLAAADVAVGVNADVVMACADSSTDSAASVQAEQATGTSPQCISSMRTTISPVMTECAAPAIGAGQTGQKKRRRLPGVG